MMYYYTLLFCSLVLLTGCFTPTSATVTEYNADGKIWKVTQTGESVIKSITESTKDKTVITWESGWLAYISASTATAEEPTPTFKMGVGKTDKGAITLHKDHKELQTVLPGVIQATRENLTVTTTGLSAVK